MHHHAEIDLDSGRAVRRHIWARFLADPDYDAAMRSVLQAICLATDAHAGLLSQYESPHEPLRSWHFENGRSHDALLAHLHSEAERQPQNTLSWSCLSDASGTESHLCAVPLRTDAESLGLLHLAFAEAKPGLNTRDLMTVWSPLLAAKMAMHRDVQRLHGLVTQYERGFQSLDRQVRILDLERQKLAAVLNNAEIGFLVVDTQLEVTWANPAMAHQLSAGESGFNILHQRCYESVCGGAEPCPECPARRAMQNGTTCRAEVSTQGPKPRRLYTTAVPIKGGSGQVEEILLMVQDLTGIEALRKSEARYRLLFETSLDAIFMVDPETFRILIANPATHSLLGYDGDEISHLALPDIHPPDTWERLRDYYRRALSGSPRESQDCPILHRGGARLHANLIALPFELEGRRVIMCNLRDITARKHAEEDLARSISLLQGTLESTADGILVVDNEGQITSFNQKFLEMWSLPPDVVTSRSFECVLSTIQPLLRDPDAFVQKVRYLSGHRNQESWDLVELRDGRTLERYSKPQRTHEQSVGRVWSFRDITARTQAERSLKNRLEFENLIAKLSSHFINLGDTEIDTGIDHALCAIGEFAGVDRSYIFLYSDDGRRFSNTHEWCAPGIDSARHLIQDVPLATFPWLCARLDTLKPIQIPRVADLPDAASAERRAMQEQSIQSLVAVPLSYGKVITGILGFDAVHAARDWSPDTVALLQIAGELLTNALMRKRAEADKIRLEEQLRQSQKMEAVGTLAGGIAHDFNNLLTGILGYADMLGSGRLAPEQVRKAASVIDTAARRAAELTQQLLGFARKGKYQNISVDLHKTIDEVTALLDRTLDKSITIRRDYDAGAAHIMGDPVQIQQVILNLSVNARDAMSSGGTLTFTTRHVSPDTAKLASGTGSAASAYVQLTVEDTGCGMTDDIQERVFEPFFTTKEQGKGTGMGLSMVYGIVKNHGGTIAVRSEPGQGTRFEIVWPAAVRETLEPSEEPTQPSTERSARILLVDDEEVVREVASIMLETLGYTVTTAVDGRDAVAIFRQAPDQFDVVILDMAMPHLSGRECFRKLKAIRPDVCAILSTGFALDDTAQEILDEGMRGFAQKPYAMQELAALVEGVLDAEPESPPRRP